MRTLCKKALALCLVFALALTCFVGTLSVSAADVSYDAIVSVNASPVTLGDTTAEAVIHITLAESGICEALIKVSSEIGSVAKEVELVKDINGTPFDNETKDETTGLTEFEALDYKVDYSGESSDLGAFFLSTKEYENDDITEAFIKVTFTIGDIKVGPYPISIDTPEGKVIAASKSEDIIKLIYDPEANPFTVTCEHNYGETVEVTAPTCTAAGAGTQTCSICKHVKDVEIPATGKHAYTYELGNGETHNFTCTVGGETGSEPCVPGEDGKTCVCGYVFVTAPETFTVTFVDADGTVLKTEEVEAGAAATAPEVASDPDNNTYFTGWDKDFSNITEDTTVTAKYKELAIRLMTYSTVFGSSIDMKFYIGTTKGSISDDAIAEIGVLAWGEDTYDAANTVYDSQYAYPIERDTDGNIVLNNTSWCNAKVARYAKQMTDDINVRAYAILKTGEIIYARNSAATKYQSILTTSLAEYADAQFGTDDEAYDNLLVALLNYGAATQTSFDYKIDDLANAGLTEGQKIVPEPTLDYNDIISRCGSIKNNSATVEDADNTRIRSASLVFGELIYIKYYITNNESKAIKNFYLLSWDEATYNDAQENKGGAFYGTEVEASLCNLESDGRYSGKTFGIYPKAVRDTVYARGYIEYEDGSVGYTNAYKFTAEFNAYSEINANNDAELYKAMLAYCDAAATKFSN